MQALATTKDTRKSDTRFVQAMMSTYRSGHTNPRDFYRTMINNVWVAVQVVAQDEGWSSEETTMFGGAMEDAIRRGLADKGILLD